MDVTDSVTSGLDAAPGARATQAAPATPITPVPFDVVEAQPDLLQRGTPFRAALHDSCSAWNKGLQPSTAHRLLGRIAMVHQTAAAPAPAPIRSGAGVGVGLGVGAQQLQLQQLARDSKQNPNPTTNGATPRGSKTPTAPSGALSVLTTNPDDLLQRVVAEAAAGRPNAYRLFVGAVAQPLQSKPAGGAVGMSVSVDVPIVHQLWGSFSSLSRDETDPKVPDFAFTDSERAKFDAKILNDESSARYSIPQALRLPLLVLGHAMEPTTKAIFCAHERMTARQALWAAFWDSLAADEAHKWLTRLKVWDSVAKDDADRPKVTGLQVLLDEPDVAVRGALAASGVLTLIAAPTRAVRIRRHARARGSATFTALLAVLFPLAFANWEHRKKAEYDLGVWRDALKLGPRAIFTAFRGTAPSQRSGPVRVRIIARRT